MIAANVAAAETLEAKRTPLIYRVHDARRKRSSPRSASSSTRSEFKLPKSGTLKPAQFNRILADTRATPTAELISEVVLRSQAQAEYHPSNYGHFGLNLRRYAHFTSPIRRYADLVVHRAIIRSLGLGKDGLTDHEIEAASGDRAIHLRHRAPRHAGRARDVRPSDRGVSCRPDRLTLPGPRVGYGAHRPVRQAERDRRRWVRPGLLDGHEYFYHDEVRQALVGEETGLPFGSATASRCDSSRQSRPQERFDSRC